MDYIEYKMNEYYEILELYEDMERHGFDDLHEFLLYKSEIEERNY